MKKALLIISFGSSYKKARESIENIEIYLSSRFAGYDYFRAFTSHMVIKKLAERDAIEFDTPEQALKKLQDMGYKEVVCQSLHVIRGFEYEKTYNELLRFVHAFDSLKLGAPLLSDPGDYEYIAQMYREIAANHDAILLMGHGTSHSGNAAYAMLIDYLESNGVKNVYIATVEGFPTLENAIGKMKHEGVCKVTVMPFMIVAGDHAQNDMAGNTDHSWKNILESIGFETTIVLKGLGDYEAVAELFCRHAKTAKKLG